LPWILHPYEQVVDQIQLLRGKTDRSRFDQLLLPEVVSQESGDSKRLDQPQCMGSNNGILYNVDNRLYDGAIIIIQVVEWEVWNDMSIL